ncbi:MAG TPA: hypothetical protein VE685_18465, partial [Thermoanaerobaculia bacterium]|nr:hypothetical protein [Thermoanaerobaculia bacterium]
MRSIFRRLTSGEGVETPQSMGDTASEVMGTAGRLFAGQTVFSGGAPWTWSTGLENPQEVAGPVPS